MKEKNLEHKIPNIKNSKGITLIALIITIVVLLIIAVVTIETIKESNIIGYAENAAAEYNQAKTNEDDKISAYESYIASKIPGEKTVSIAGTYGNSNKESGDYSYWILNEDGTGTRTYYGYSPDGERIEDITYTVDENGNGVMYSDGDDEGGLFEFKVINGNKGLYVYKYTDKWDGPYSGRTIEMYEAVLTENGTSGLEKVGTKTYSAIDSDFQSASFENGIITLYGEDGTEEKLCEDYFVIKTQGANVGESVAVVYMQEAKGMYYPELVIWDDTYIQERPSYGS